ncbi:enoyl-CoA hydratase/isomerase family protein [Falsigemmobacter faecalis]|uniref:Enoyl-CoA hydratase/isomerase family protein n=1 Tax=Falsigemmobacter faecalis TaxID=2488730 RepID=A0A3P3DBJ8_9RHOB|nr:enoyl-CoA hydratase/isomerase family protein [Falsigemmobacter faecalis]RRH69768.1 enoyl-CoA hydratase/isomerase family protein [Falsigemmobacter faecalis]
MSAPSEAAVLLQEVEAGIVVLTLNRPKKLNALSPEVMAELEARLQDLALWPGLRVVIVTGAGRAFCAGGDLAGFLQLAEEDPEALLETLAYNQRVLSQVEALPVPVIAAVNGVAVAGGLELMLCCDLLMAAEGAMIGDGHARYGIVPAGGATLRLGERMAPAVAARLLYTAELLPAQDLVFSGLLTGVVPPADLMERCLDLARQIARQSPGAIRHARALTRGALHSPERQARLDAEITAFASHLRGQDLYEGLRAFREGRTPVYGGGLTGMETDIK